MNWLQQKLIAFGKDFWIENDQGQKVFKVKYDSHSDKKVYFVRYESQADLKIFMVEYKSQAGWRNTEKQHLLF